VIQAGYAQAAITPALDRPVYLAGFGNNRRAESVHDELTVRALALQSETTTLALVALDLIGFFRRDVYDVIRAVQTTHPRAQVLIASTHTHHGPDTLGLWGPNAGIRGVDEAWLSATKATIAATIQTALVGLEPVTAAWAEAEVPRWVKNARNPEIVDATLTALQVTRDDGRVLATLVNYPCHPEVLWEHNPHITADYVHALREETLRQTGAPALFFAGALGGMLTPDVVDHSFAEAEAMGVALAEAGLAALAQTGSVRDLTLAVASATITPTLTNPLYRLAFWRKLLPDTRDRRGRIETEVHLIKIGGLWLATVPGELFPKLGLRLKARLRAAGAEATGVIGLANDELGYILPEEDFKYPWNPFRPGAHYEETNSIGKDIGPQVMEGLKGLL
jgi:hypothetical protein